MSSKDELDIVLDHIRVHDEYRTKIFGFYVALNGVLISFMQALASDRASFIYLYIFAFVATMFGLINSIRSAKITDRYRKAAIDIERELGFKSLLSVHESIYEEIEGRKFVLRHAYAMFYVLMLVMWSLLIYGL